MNSQPDIADTGSIEAACSRESGLARTAMSAARLAQARWATVPIGARLAKVRELRCLIARQALTLATASASTRRRPPLESLTAEVLPLAEACRFLEREARSLLSGRRLAGSSFPLWLSGMTGEVRREPLGVILIIGPGNYPLLIPGVQILQALVAGNAVLLKPGAGGSKAASAFVEVMRSAGLDQDLVTLLPESAEAVVAAIDSGPDKVVFTGSAATGEKILTQLARHLIPATMELSGSDAFIVRADADLDLVVKSLKFGLELNGGATCMAPKRVFVHRAIATELEGRLAQTFSAGARPDFGRKTIASGPLSPVTATTERLKALLAEAMARGAHLVSGEVAADGTIQFPIILAGVDPQARLSREDVFAPVLSIISVADDSEAIARANDCPYALGASVFSRDESAAGGLATGLNVGVVTINDLLLPTADARVPFGGRKRSGFGVTRGAEGLLEMTATKFVSVSRAKYRPALEPARPRDEAMFQSYLDLTHGRGFFRRARALTSLFKSLAGRTKPNTEQSS